MSNERRARLKELLKDKNTLHNTTTTLRTREEKLREKRDAFSESVRIATAKTAKTPSEDSTSSEDGQNLTAKTAKTPSEDSTSSEDGQNLTAKTAKTPEAEQLGLVATWSVEFGFVTLHDPTSGQWHDLPTKEAPSWAVSEARKRKELYRDGNRRAYRLTSREMEEIWKTERPLEEEGIVEEYPIEE